VTLTHSTVDQREVFSVARIAPVFHFVNVFPLSQRFTCQCVRCHRFITVPPEAHLRQSCAAPKLTRARLPKALDHRCNTDYIAATTIPCSDALNPAAYPVTAHVRAVFVTSTFTSDFSKVISSDENRWVLNHGNSFKWRCGHFHWFIQLLEWIIETKVQAHLPAHETV